jgi:hypothetical protein
MRRVWFGGGSFLTGDDIAEALVRLVALMLPGASIGVVAIPGVSEDGRALDIHLAVTHSTTLVSIPENAPWDEPDAVGIVEYLDALAGASSRRPRNRGGTQPEDPGWGLNDI